MKLFGKKEEKKDKESKATGKSRELLKSVKKEKDKAKKGKKEKIRGPKPKKGTPGKSYRVVIEPMITEKGANLEMENKYIFRVAATSNKKTIAESIEEVYGVRPLKIWVMNFAGKNRRYGQTTGRTAGFKKAVVAMPKGTTLQVHEGV